MKNYIKPILAVFIFLISQLGGTALALVYAIASDENVRNAIMRGDKSVNLAALLNSEALSLSLLISGILTILCLYVLNFVDKRAVFRASDIRWKWAPVVVIAAFAGIFATNMLNEWVELPDLMAENFIGMSKTAIGMFSIAILGPVVEELTFREAFIGNLVKAKINPWIAIILSSLCFGLMHGNPAQIPFASTIGIVLGIVYYKMGNIIISSIIHILNNSIGVIQMNLLGEEADDFMFKDVLGSADFPVIFILATCCIFVLYKFWHQYVPRIVE